MELQVEIQRKYHKATSILDCLKGQNFWHTAIAIRVQILQHAQGVSFIQNSIVVLMQQLGSSDSLRTDLMVTRCGFASHIVTFQTFGRMGRRNLLMLEACGIAVRMFGIGGTTAAGGVASLFKSAQNPCAAMLILSYSLYGFIWGPDCWIVPAEIGTGHSREWTLFLASMRSFITSAPINFVDPYIQAAIGGSVKFTYERFSVLAVLFISIVVPETRYRSLEELFEMFQASVKTKQLKRYICAGLGAQITHSEGKGIDNVYLI